MQTSLTTRTICLLLAGLLTAFLSSCNQNNATDSKGAEPTRHIVVSYCKDDSAWMSEVERQMQEAVKALETKSPDTKVTILGATDAQNQVLNISEMLLNQLPDALVILPKTPEKLSRFCSELHQNGVLIAAVNSNIAFPENPNILVTGENERIGMDSANALVKAIDEKGSILIFADYRDGAFIDRETAFKRQIRQYPAIDVTEIDCSASDKTPKAQMLSLLKSGKHFDGIWTGWDPILLEVLEAINESNATGIKACIGCGASYQVTKLMTSPDNLVPINMTYPTEMLADGIQAAYRIISTQDKTEYMMASPEIIVLPSRTITRDNALSHLNTKRTF